MSFVDDQSDENTVTHVNVNIKHRKKKRKRYSKRTKRVERYEQLPAKHWETYQDHELIAIGKRRAETKTGYEYGVNYDFREFYPVKEWDEIIYKALNKPPRTVLVPFKKVQFSDSGTETEGYED